MGRELCPQSGISLLVKSLFLLGCTRFGSPGIFGVPPSYRSCLAAYFQLASISHAAGCRASFRPPQAGAPTSEAAGTTTVLLQGSEHGPALIIARR
jgi:hypothetical protein